jgi:hypothetical protein
MRDKFVYATPKKNSIASRASDVLFRNVKHGVEAHSRVRRRGRIAAATRLGRPARRT